MPIQKKDFENFISLAEAAKTCRYSQEYLALRAYQGELKAEKIGRNWATKQEWLDEYLQRTSHRKNGSQLEKKYSLSSLETDLSGLPESTKRQSAKKDKKKFVKIPSSLPTRESSFAPAGAAEDKLSPELKDNPIEVKDKTYPIFANVFNFRFAFALTFVFVLISIGIVSISNISDISQSLQSLRTFDDVYLQVAQVSAISTGMSKDYFSWTKDKILDIPKTILDIPKTIFTALRNAKDKLVGIFQKQEKTEECEHIAKIDEKLKQEKADALEEGIISCIHERFKEFEDDMAFERQRQGVMIVPKEDGKEAEGEIAKLKNSFSDEVIIEPSEDGTSGIIKPVFREASDQEYLYLMMPVK